MKKIYMLLMALAATAMMATAQDTPTLLWANNFNYQNADGASITNIGYNTALAQDGNLLIFNQNGTQNTDQNVYFGENFVATGSNYSGSSYNNGFCLVKADAVSGEALWSVYCNSGEGTTSNATVIATNDGGAMLVFIARHSLGYANQNINFVDATGNSTEIDWALDDANGNRYFKGFMLKVSKEGAIEWYRVIDVNHDPQPSATTYNTNTGQGLYIYDATADESGNVFIAGRFCTALTFDNGTTITPVSTDGWDGDPQKTRGDLFVAKFDAQGNFMEIFTQSGVTTFAGINKLAVNDGKIYFVGYLQGAGNTISMGDVELAQASGYRDLVIGRMDTDLNVEWAKLLTTAYSGSAYNNLMVNVIGENMWISGKVRANLSDESGNNYDWSTLNRDGMLLRLNKNNGTWLGATANGVANSGFNGVIGDSNNPGVIYVYGHELVKNLFLKAYNVEDLTAGEVWNFHNVCSDLQNATVDGRKLYTMSRAKKGEVVINYANGDGTYTLNQANGFNTVICAFELPIGVTTAVAEVETTNMKVFAVGNTIHVVTNKAAIVPVFNMMGAQVANIKATAGDNTVTLPAGIYVANGQKMLVR